MHPTWWMLNERREEGCISITTERKYFKVGNIFIKRCLRPLEWQLHPVEGRVIIPRFGKERIQNEANSLRFISEQTNIPVPKFIGHFEDDGAVYLITEFVEGIAMSELPENQRKEVEVEVEAHLQTLKQLKSSQWGGPSGLVS